MSKTHKTAVVLIPPEDVWEPIQEIRRAHDRQVLRWMPHVTLLYPFRPAGEFGPAAEALRARLSAIPPFEVTLVRFRHFAHGPASFTVWLEPEPADALRELHRALLEACPDCDDTARHPGGFHPHVSVGQFRGRRAALDRFLARLADSWRALRFAADRVSLIARGDPPDDVFRVALELPLGGGSPRRGDPGRAAR